MKRLCRHLSDHVLFAFTNYSNALTCVQLYVTFSFDLSNRADEPVWAIGTGLVCPPEVAQEVHSFIRSLVARKYGHDIANKSIIQYGGSVKPDNVKEIMAMPDIDGCLVGGASLVADSFAKIIKFKQ